MLPISSQTRFFLYSEPTDMRKSFDGLSGIVSNELNGNPLSGDVYIFINKRRDRIKLLVWDRNGFWLFYKRLEKGRFQEINFKNKTGAYISYESLIMLLEGIDLNSVKRRKRYAEQIA
jgi:transposase